MCYTDLGFAKELMELGVEDMQRQFELHSLLRQTGAEPQGWFTSQGHRLLGQLGHQLVAWGRRLEGHSLPQPTL